MPHANSPVGSLDDPSNLLAHTVSYTSQSATRKCQAVKTTTINNVQFLQQNFLKMLTIYYSIKRVYLMKPRFNDHNLSTN